MCKSHSELPLIADLHCDTALEVQAGVDLGLLNPHGHVDLPRLRAGRVGFQVFAAYVASVIPEELAFKRAIELLDGVVGQVRAHPGELALVESPKDVLEAWGSGRVAAMLAVENGHAIQADLARLETFRRRGVCIMTLTHSANLSWAGSSGEPDAPGLTSFGREVVSEMERLGILVDLSHVSVRTFWDVARMARRPFIASHSNASALCPVARNLDDDQLRAVADSGGLVGINFFPGFLDSGYSALLPARVGELFHLYQAIEADNSEDHVARMWASRQITARLQDKMRDAAVPLERVCEHIEYIISLIGDSHVAFGGDLDGVPDLPAGMGGCDIYPTLLQMLQERGQESLERIASGNVLRVLGALA